MVMTTDGDEEMWVRTSNVNEEAQPPARAAVQRVLSRTNSQGILYGLGLGVQSRPSSAVAYPAPCAHTVSYGGLYSSPLNWRCQHTCQHTH